MMNCYYRSKYEGAGYIKRLEKIFKEHNPVNRKINNFVVTNTLANKVRSLITRKVISMELLNETRIKAEHESLMAKATAINSSLQQSVQNLNNSQSLISNIKRLDTTENITLTNTDTDIYTHP